MNHEMFEKRFIEILMSEGVDVNKKNVSFASNRRKEEIHNKN